ncbi:hypothetical protein B0T17DRAFT_593084 [Bombardia bombarda]|uniref:Wax synthase domain-containing protein n=1 Tax=Bombardia bombarda TaxID=252184 RepID=A0AA39W4X6_9PEZI|nr:hypothetical protein B0T17DRAFT_593084 [Bombardia bombarda]
MDHHPVFDLVAVVTISSLTIGFVSIYISRNAWATSVVGYTLSYLWQYLDAGLLSKWTYEKQGPENEVIKPWGPSSLLKSGTDDSFASRFRFGFATMFSWRFADTPYRARGLPKLDEKLRKSRSGFLAHTLTTVTVCYLFLDVMDASADPALTDKFYSLDKVAFFSRLGQVSAEEFMMRMFAAFGLGAGLVSVQRGVYSICAFVASLRSFWSTFWHQTNTHRLRVTSNWILFDVLRLPRESKAARYARPWIIFLLSAVFHVAIDVSSGPLGIVVEDLLTTWILSGSTAKPASSAGRPTALQRWGGALWVLLWMTWTAPAYMFPVLAKAESDKGVVPLSLIGLVTKQLQ